MMLRRTLQALSAAFILLVSSAAAETPRVDVTQSQIAATIAAFVGEDFTAASPQAAKPLPVFGVSNGAAGEARR